MTRERLFDIWAPRDSVWSPWSKAVLISQYIPQFLSVPPQEQVDLPFEIGQSTAVVVELPGAMSVCAGLALAHRGFRPVPLFNAIPRRCIEFDPAMENVDLHSILNTLAARAEELSAIHLPADAPPAFLLDANRRRRPPIVREGMFDNRSICFSTDFPSAVFLAEHGVNSVLCIQRSALPPQEDLQPTLARWQRAGLSISMANLDTGAPPAPITVRSAWSPWRLMYEAIVTMRLRRNSTGGFGRTWLPAEYGGAG